MRPYDCLALFRLTSGHNAIFPVVAGFSLSATTMFSHLDARVCPDVSDTLLTSERIHSNMITDGRWTAARCCKPSVPY